MVKLEEWFIASYQLGGRASAKLGNLGQALIANDGRVESGNVNFKPVFEFINARFNSNLSFSQDLKNLGISEVYVVLDKLDTGKSILFSYGVAHTHNPHIHHIRPNPHVFYVVVEYSDLKQALDSFSEPINLSKFVAHTFDWLNSCKHWDGEPYTTEDMHRINKEAESKKDPLGYVVETLKNMTKKYEEKHGKVRHELDLFTYMTKLHVLDTSETSGVQTYNFDRPRLPVDRGFPTLRG